MSTVKRVTLLNALGSVNAGLASKELIEQSTSFIFHNNKVSTFNDEIAATAELEGDFGVEFDGAIDADILLKLLNKTKDDELEIEIVKDEMKIKGKKFETGIKHDPEIKLPLDDVEMPDDEDFVEVPDNFSQLLKLACLTASKTLSEALLTCVHLCEDRIESCDNDRITVCHLDVDLESDVLVSARNLLEIAKENIEAFAFDDTWAHFKTKEDVLLSCRLYNEEYVDLSEFIPEEEGEAIQFPEQLAEALDRADVFSKDSVSMEKIIKVSIKKKKMEIFAANESGWIKEKDKVKYSGPELSFSINIDFLRDILKMTNEISVVEDTLMIKDQQSIHLVKLDE